MLNCFQLEKADRNTQIPRTPSAHSEITESLYLQSVFRSNAFVPVTSLLQTISLQLLDSAFTWSKGLRRSRKVLSEIYIIFQIKRKPNPIIVLWFNQNHLYFKNKQKTAYLSTIGVPNRPFLNLVIPTTISSNPVIPRVIFDIPPLAHTFNPESLPDFAVKSRIPSFK